MSFSDWEWLLAWLAIETAFLIIVAALLARRFRSPRIAGAIWRTALAAVALVWLAELANLREHIPTLHSQPGFSVTVTVGPAMPHARLHDGHPALHAAPQSQAAAALVKWPAWIWLAGALVLLTRFTLGRVWLEFRRQAAAEAAPDSFELVSRWRKSFGLRHVRLQIWPGLRAPAAFGIFRPTIALPPDLAQRYSPPEREAMLAHELAHLAAHDPFWWMLADAVVTMAWWHPFAWWARRRMQDASEAAADEASALVPGGPHVLATCLVRLGRELTEWGPVRALGIRGDGARSKLGARVKLLLRQPQAWRPPSVWMRWMPQSLAIVAAFGSVLLPIQTGLSGSVLAVLATPSAPRAELPASKIPSPSVEPLRAPVALDAGVEAAPAVIPAPASLPSPRETPTTSPTAQTSSVSEARPTSQSASATLLAAAPLRQEADEGPASSTPSSPPPDARSTKAVAVKLSVQVVAIEDQEAARFGFDSIFGPAQTNAPPIEISHDPAALGASLEGENPRRPGSFHIQHPENLVIDRIHSQGQSAVLESAQFAALRKQIQDKTPTNVLTTPTIVTFSGQEARVCVQKQMTVVMGVKAGDSSSPGASVNYLTDDVSLGLNLGIVPALESNGNCGISMDFRMTSFEGYDDYGKDFGDYPVAGGKPLSYQRPHPHFRSVEADASTPVPLGQTLALRSPVWTEQIKTKGHFLAPARTTTLRKRLYVFVTPTLPTPKDMERR